MIVDIYDPFDEAEERISAIILQHMKRVDEWAAADPEAYRKWDDEQKLIIELHSKLEEEGYNRETESKLNRLLETHIPLYVMLENFEKRKEL